MTSPPLLRRRSRLGSSDIGSIFLVGIGGAISFAALACLSAPRGLESGAFRSLIPKAKVFVGTAARRAAGSRFVVGTTVSALVSGSPMTAAAFGWGKPIEMLSKTSCLPGRDMPIPNSPATEDRHFLLKTPMYPPFPEGTEMISLGMGCFWCSENLFMRMPGVYSTHVGYAQGETLNPTYEEVCSGRTNHNEVVRVVYDPKKIGVEDILKVFWDRHDPTTPNQQGNDRGTQYRSGIYTYTDEQKKIAEKSKEVYQSVLTKQGFGKITTEIEPAKEFYYAEMYHQQYDAKPGSRQYCGLSPLGTSFPQESLQSS
ncbi:hypothetical protein AAMO2058_000453600 [Amorphochlora amoebiformis]